MSNFVFGQVPVIKHSRSRFDLSHSVKTTANVGTLYPFEVQEVVPGDTFKVNASCVSRLSSQFVRPVMDNLFLDVYWFYVPSRILYDKFVNVFGENTESAWANSQEYEVPSVSLDTGWGPDSVACHMGIPPQGKSGQPKVNGNLSVSLLPFRAFAKIYDDWFRDENNIPPMHIQHGEFVDSENLNDSPWGPGNYTGLCPKVSRMHDLFSSALPAPQKGNAVEVSTGVLPSMNIPVTTADQVRILGEHPSLKFTRTDGSFIGNPRGLAIAGGAPGRLVSTDDVTLARSDEFYPNNLELVFPQTPVGAVSVNDLRFAFQYQKMLERDARSGSRFTEYLQAHFGVSAGDSRLQRSEFLGGRRSPISIHQVVQSTGEGSESSPLGSVGAYSWSNSKSRFTKGFVEPGYVIGVFCIRQFHTYQQGIDKHWFKFKRSDYYEPVFAHIGEQPLFLEELDVYHGSETNKREVFGYQEAWVDLRQRVSRVTGQLTTMAQKGLDVWHFADYYSSRPVLGQEFIEETPVYVDRAITAESSEQDQFILDFYIQNIAYRPLPTYSVPGLIDHN